MIARIKAAISKVADLQTWTNRLGGRSYALIVFFAVTAFLLALGGRLTDSYAMVITALSGFHVCRTIASDHFEDRDKDRHADCSEEIKRQIL